MKRSFPALAVLCLLSGCVTIERYPSTVTTSAVIAKPLPSSAPGFSSRLIRVAIVMRQASVHLAAPESFLVSGFPLNGTPAAEGEKRRYRETTLTSTQLYAGGAMIEPQGDGEIKVNGRGYRGTMEIVEDKKGTLTVINEVPLEEYVMGVLAGEIPRNWPREALKAQAIAARTFAVLKRSEARRRKDPYDLENTALFQMYQGSGLVNDNIREAVLRTSGEILTQGKAPIAAFFHSNCGGRTCRSSEVWSQDKPYLRSAECTYGNNGEHFRWRAEMKVADLVQKLRKGGLGIGDVIRLEARSRDESGRISELAIMDETGRFEKMKGSDFRMKVGPDLIRSTRFDPQIVQDKVVFIGKGWGHGVGLCQEGACGMALKGFGAFDILRHYYRGVMIEKMRDHED